ncbi:MAG: hypothetical protein OXG60_08110 [Chloroflexi bacterium]|nr:hypothetical protein [Chloroflexota bacterium]
MMSFTGFSSDQEGSIVYDGEKFIINNPEKVPENFDPGDKPVIYTRPPAPKPPASTTPNSQPAPATTHQQNNMLNQDFNYVVAGVGEPKDKKKKKKKRDALAAGSGEQAIPGFSEHEGIRDISEAGLIDFEPEEATSLTGYTAVSEGQRQHIDYLLSTVDDDLAWVALVVVKEYGLPSKEQYAEYMSQFAGSGLDDESDQLALSLLDQVRHSDWDDFLAQADSAPVEARAQDLADNTIEGLTVIEAKTGRTLLNRTGVLGADGQQYVGLQDYEVEAFKGLDLIFIHNHPNGSDASEADLRAAFAAGAEMLMVVTPQGYEYVYIRGARGMIRIRAEEASYEVAPGTAQEHALLEARSWAQARADRLNPPELVFLQQDPEVIANMDVNPHEIARYEELKNFVNTGLDELQGKSEKELLAKIGKSMDLLHDIFGYTFKFHDKYDVGANVELAMEQVYNLGIILFHFLNDFGKEIMESTPEETIYILGADERIAKDPEAEFPKHQGLVVLPESTAKGNPDLKIVYLGSEIEAGTIGHEVAHEIDRRMGDYGTVKVEYQEDSSLPISELGPVGSFLWFLKNEVINQRVNLPKGDAYQGYNLASAAEYLDEDARANISNAEREVFADLVAAKVLGPLDKDYFSTAFADTKPIRFLNKYGSADIAIALEQYFDQHAEYRSDTNAKPPEAFSYTKYHDWQRYDELEWPVMPIEEDEE